MNNIYLSLIIPAYNEENRIVSSLEKAVEFLQKQTFTWEILVVDDGSTDKTCDIVKKFNSEHPGLQLHLLEQLENFGKGAAVKRGMLDAVGEYRIFTDADFSTPIHEVLKILPVLASGTDVCIGSRALDRKMVKEHQPFYREWMGKTFNKFVQLLVFKGITDTQCGFKGFSAKAAKEIFSRAKINGFSFDVEALYLAKTLNYSVKEIPVEWYNDNRSKVNPISDSANMFFELLKIRRLNK